MNVIMTEAWSALPNSINIEARGCNYLRFEIFSLKCPARDVKKKKKRREIDRWVDVCVGVPWVKVLFWPPLNIYCRFLTDFDIYS